MEMIKKSEMLKNIDLIKNEIVDIYYTSNTVFEGKYFTKYNEYDFDIFLAYADRAYDLAKNYRNNFNKAAIEPTALRSFAVTGSPS